MQSPQYRADIDGLRAVAVLAVIGYHFFPQWVPAGFAGVDVFFVISGFLITGIIADAIEAGRFSLVDFYARRIRRIFPALIVVLLACVAAGWGLLYSDEYRLLGNHVAAGAGFVTNILLWRETGYFDAAAETKPLLHLWSLGVEEQFYIVWPLVLAYLCRTARARFATVAVVFIASLAACIAVTALNPVQAFYLPVYRFWELMAGASLALHPQWQARSQADSNVRSLAGIALLLACGAVIQPGSPFPGWRALVPVFATFLLLSAGAGGIVNRVVLSHRWVVAVGLISYPLYLWHWPLLSMLRIANNDAPVTFARGLVLLAASFLLAWATYRVIERPVRYGRFGGRRAIAAAAVMGCVAALGLAISLKEGVPSREVNSRDPTWPSRVGPYATDVRPMLLEDCGLPPEQSRLLARCVRDSRGVERFALVGDSKADAMFHGLVRTSTEAGRWMFVGGATGHDSVEPELFGKDRHEPYVLPSRIAFEAVARDRNVETVVIVAATRALFHLSSNDSIEDLATSPWYDEARDGLGRFVTGLLDAGKKVVIVVDNPTLPDPKLCMTDARITWHGKVGNFLGIGKPDARCEISIDRHLELSARYRKLLSEVQRIAPDRITLFDLEPFLCDMARRRCGAFDGDMFLYSFADHVSDAASMRIGKALNDSLVNGGVQKRGRDSSSNKSL